MHKKLLKKIIENGRTEDMEYLEHLLDELVYDLKVNVPTKYKHIKLELYKRVYGEHLNEELAREWVKEMQNKDGSTGEHWTYEQTSQYAGNHNKCDWYAVMNMIWSDMFNPKFDTNTYIELANDWINDKDVEDGKTLRYYMYVVSCD